MEAGKDCVNPSTGRILLVSLYSNRKPTVITIIVGDLYDGLRRRVHGDVERIPTFDLLLPAGLLLLLPRTPE